MRRAQVQKFTERKIHKKLHYFSTVEGIISFKGTFVRMGVVRPREAYPELTNIGDKRFKNWGQERNTLLLEVVYHRLQIRHYPSKGLLIKAKITF